MKCLKEQKNIYPMPKSEEFNFKNNSIYTTTYCWQTQYVVVLFFFLRISTKYYTKRQPNNCEYLLYFHKIATISCVFSKNSRKQNTRYCVFCAFFCWQNVLFLLLSFTVAEGWSVHLEANSKTIKLWKRENYVSGN